MDQIAATVALIEKIAPAWSKETSATPESWRPGNPAAGQCAVTALVVQDIAGGELLRCVVDGHVSHYFNRLPDGTEIDLTRSQFKGRSHFSEPEIRNRSYVLSYPATAARYELLKERIGS
jgi:hypothetical protein